ncbi:MAG: cellulase family glycosylhydrolase [Eubacteriales bacterium]|nr:cellulase family glycosylhydrolase [Eubacteriales bacterium]
MQINGVNLGNWLVLEKWMSPELFAGTDAEDEYWLPRRLSRDVYEARIRQHRSEYINERDFMTIKSWGLDTVRIPVPYFIFGDREPFIGCIEELDKAFAWAEKYGLKILIDLHTAPEGQNGFDNGGISGVCKWAQNPSEVEFVLTVLERLAERYAKRDGLWGIEVLNEPVSEEMWTLAEIQKKYPPVDQEMAAGSKGIPIDFLRQFYTDAYERIRVYLPEDKYVVIHDGFRITMWKDFMQENRFKNVVLDTHQYLMMAEMMGYSGDLNGYDKMIDEVFIKGIEEMENYFPVICGEWCLFNSLASTGMSAAGPSIESADQTLAKARISDSEKSHIYQYLAKAQLSAWGRGSGHFYWSYKLLIDTVNQPEWIGWDSWDLGRCVAAGWLLPEFFQREQEAADK